MEPTNKSEVARLREQLELECQALKRFTAPAMVASHAMITNRYNAIEKHAEALGKIVGQEQATEIMCQIYNKEVQ